MPVNGIVYFEAGSENEFPAAKVRIPLCPEATANVLADLQYSAYEMTNAPHVVAYEENTSKVITPA